MSIEACKGDNCPLKKKCKRTEQKGVPIRTPYNVNLGTCEHLILKAP